MQPPGAGGKDSLAASQVMGAGFAVPVDEGLIAPAGQTGTSAPGAQPA
jgi:hypothetical protein